MRRFRFIVGLCLLICVAGLGLAQNSNSGDRSYFSAAGQAHAGGIIVNDEEKSSYSLTWDHPLLFLS